MVSGKANHLSFKNSYSLLCWHVVGMVKLSIREQRLRRVNTYTQQTFRLLWSSQPNKGRFILSIKCVFHKFCDWCHALGVKNKSKSTHHSLMQPFSDFVVMNAVHRCASYTILISYQCIESYQKVYFSPNKSSFISRKRSYQDRVLMVKIRYFFHLI